MPGRAVRVLDLGLYTPGKNPWAGPTDLMGAAQKVNLWVWLGSQELTKRYDSEEWCLLGCYAVWFL
jgi:hypothetical protein